MTRGQDERGIAAVAAEVAASHGDRVKVAVTDIDGVLRGKSLHKEKFASALRGGFGFCSVLFGWDCNDRAYDRGKLPEGFAGYPDVQAHIDPKTFRRVPWDENVPLFLADFCDAGAKPLPWCPRQLLKGVLARLARAGFEAQVGVELEWFNFAETPASLAAKGHHQPQPMTPGMFGYSLARAAHHADYVRALFNDTRAFGVPVEGLHTETGPGVLEAAILHCNALEAADRGVLFKEAVREIAARFGIVASFMAKWRHDLPGSGGHLHQSLCDKAGANVFYDARETHGMSATFRHYIAGQVLALPCLAPLLLPTVNSYKRLREGAWAPTHLGWGLDNRTAALRAIAGSSQATRLETRVGGADINPYLALAACLASGLYGIEHRLELPEQAVAENGYRGAASMPTNLQEGTRALADSALARELLGDAFVDHFVATRRWEWEQFEMAVTDWERQRYFEVI